MCPAHVDGPSGVELQTITVHAPSTAPYALTATVKLPSGQKPVLGVRKSAGDASAWFPTEQELIAQMQGVNYWDVKAYIDSGVAVSFKVDSLTDPMEKLESPGANPDGDPLPDRVASLVNTDAYRLMQTEDAVVLAFQIKGETFRVSLTGNFNEEDKMWSGQSQHSGWHRRGNIIRELYKHIPVVHGGSMGYLHISATIMAATPEVQFKINWHNGGIEERSGKHAGFGDLGSESNLGSPPSPFGQFRGQDIIFGRMAMELSKAIPPAVGFEAAAWTWTPQLPDSVHSVANGAFVKVISGTAPNKLHVVPITAERPFRFAVHPVGVTPYAKHVIGMCNWEESLGGVNFTPMGIPKSLLPAIDLAAEATACKDALTALSPWQCEGDSASGMIPPNALWPGSYSSYGGMTGGIGMVPWYGIKWLATAQKAGHEILLTEQLRVRARTHGALYYNISGLPVDPLKHAGGTVQSTWNRFNRTFLKSGGSVKDAPFYVTAPARRMGEAHYNPGPRGTGLTPLDSASDPTPGTPDWWMQSHFGSGVTPPVFAFGPGAVLPLDHTTPPSGTADKSVPVIVQMQGATAFDENNSLTLRITGTGAGDFAQTEDLVCLGSLATPPPSVQAWKTVQDFKNVTKVECIAQTGEVVAPEAISIGRAQVGIPDYNGGDGITPMDDQHFIRMHHINRTLFLGGNDLLAKIYIFMDAASERMTQWEGTGTAKRLLTLDHGAQGRGATITRELFWAADVICSAYAIGCAHWDFATALIGYGRWLDTLELLLKNSQMSNKLWQAYGAKEGKQTPFGQANGGESSVGLFWMISGREAAYATHAAIMLAYALGRNDDPFKTLVGQLSLGFRDFLWHTVSAGDSALTHTYLPVAIHRDPNGTIRPPDLGVNSSGTWEVYATKAALPATNPISGCLINPTTYPPVDDDLYVGAILGNNAKFGAGAVDGAMSALTLLRNDTDSGGAGLLPTPVEFKITNAATYIGGTGQKRRWLRVTGTSPLDAAISEDMPIFGNGQATQTFRSAKHFKTVTEAIMLTQAQATALGVPNVGTLVVGESFSLGTPVVGLRYNGVSTAGENFQLHYALGYLKVLCDTLGDATLISAIDTCILRATGSGGTPAANLAAAKAVLQTYTEYQSNPGRLEQWAPLLWALRAA